MSALTLSSLNDAVTSASSAAAPIPGRWPDRIGTVLIDRRLNGPRRYSNGGFAAGSIAQHIDADTITVVLERPIPLARTLEVIGDGADGGVVVHRRRTLARAFPGHLVAAPAPAAPTFDEALLARSRHPLAGVRHPLSDCVVCGPRRVDGMHVTPGALPDDSGRLVAPWTVDARFAHAGLAWYQAVWGALDCPSYPARALHERILCLLGTMTARIERRPQVGEHLVVHSWTREQHGRRYETSVAIVDGRGASVARADTTWIALKNQTMKRAALRP